MTLPARCARLLQPAPPHPRAPRRAPLALLLALSLPALTASHATTVTLYGGAFGETPVADSSAAPLEPGQAVSIGTFAEGFDPYAPAAGLPALLGNWREFASSTTAANGSFVLNASDPDGAKPLPASGTPAFAFPGKPLYLLVLRTAPGSPSRILDFGLFTSDNTTTPWVFPAADTQNGSADNQLLIGTGQINVALDGDFLLADPRDPASPATALRLTPSAPRENE